MLSLRRMSGFKSQSVGLLGSDLLYVLNRDGAVKEDSEPVLSSAVKESDTIEHPSECLSSIGSSLLSLV